MSKLASTFGGALILVALAGCSEKQLVVQDKNAPDELRALASAADVENLIGSQFRVIHQNSDGDILNLDAQMFCLGMENASGLANGDMNKATYLPRVGIDNGRGNTTATEKYNPYLLIYRAARSVALGLHAMNATGFTFLPQSAAEVARDKAWGYFTLGVALGDIALVYDSGAVVSANDDVTQAAPLFVVHDSLMKVALADLDTAQQFASISPTPSGGNGFPIPTTGTSAWINTPTTLTGGAAGTFVQLVRSWKARFRAGVARTPADRKDVSAGGVVNWTQVIADAQAGNTADFIITAFSGSPPWTYRPIQMDLFGTWHEMWQFMLGMADTSGVYTQYLANPAGFSPFLVVTPDKRFPSGTTRAAQNTASGCISGTSCLQPVATAPYPYLRNRLTGGDNVMPPLYFSMYDFYRFQAVFNASRNGPVPMMPKAELNALIAEGYIALANYAAALPYINATRTAAGLPALTAADNTTPVPGGGACVPKVPDPATNYASAKCGNILEAMKWEKRMETAYTHWGAWWIDGRGWGDLPSGSPLEYPTPYQELDTRLHPIYSTVQVAGASTYGLK
jgi:hypothetical protein